MNSGNASSPAERVTRRIPAEQNTLSHTTHPAAAAARFRRRTRTELRLRKQTGHLKLRGAQQLPKDEEEEEKEEEEEESDCISKK
jgi:hypothetical protein